MVEVAEIFRLHGPAYRAKFGSRLLPSHRRAMQDIEQCRTAVRGGQLYFCQQCQQHRYRYHSCKNRHCPKCGNEQATAWLQAQQHLLLPTHHFLVTFTLPAQLRSLARSNQRTIYNLLFRAASQALLNLAQEPRFCGGLIGMVGVLTPGPGLSSITHTSTSSSPAVAGIRTTAGWRAAKISSCQSKPSH